MVVFRLICTWQRLCMIFNRPLMGSYFLHKLLVIFFINCNLWDFFANTREDMFFIFFSTFWHTSVLNISCCCLLFCRRTSLEKQQKEVRNLSHSFLTHLFFSRGFFGTLWHVWSLELKEEKSRANFAKKKCLCPTKIFSPKTLASEIFILAFRLTVPIS